MQRKSLMPPLSVLVFAVAFAGPALANDEAQVSFAGVEDTNGLPVDGTSILTKTEDGVAYTLSTRDLGGDHAYTNWWIVFNNPEDCVNSCECGSADFLNKKAIRRAGISVFWGTGRVADPRGQADFSAHVGYEELPDGGEVPIPGPGGIVNPDAEIHLEVRDHGLADDDPEKLEVQLTTLDGGCEGNPNDECVPAQFVIHPRPSCDADDADDDD